MFRKIALALSATAVIGGRADPHNRFRLASSSCHHGHWGGGFGFGIGIVAPAALLPTATS